MPDGGRRHRTKLRNTRRIRQEDHPPTPRADLLHIAGGLLEQLVVRGDNDYRDTFVNQRHRTVLPRPAGVALGIDPVFTGEPAATALLNDASKSHRLFGPPVTSTDEAIMAVAQWIQAGNDTLGKPTKFEARDGKF